MIAFLSVVIAGFLIWLSYIFRRCIWGNNVFSGKEILFGIVWISILAIFAWVGERIWTYSPVESIGKGIGRRIAFYIILILLVLYPFVFNILCQYGIGTLLVIVALLFALILGVAMIVKDIASVLLMIPISMFLMYLSYKSFQVAKDHYP